MFENDRVSLVQRLLCLVLATVLSAGFGPGLMAQEDPGPGGDTTPAPAPEQPPPPADPVPAPAPEGGAPPEQAPAGKIQGQLLDLDGTTPIPNEQVNVLDGKGNTVATATSGPDGKFELPMLQDGEYTLQTRGIQQRFSVTPDQPIKELKILVPAAPFAPAAGGTGDGDTDVDPDKGGGWWIPLGAGAVLLVGGLIAGAVLAIANNSGKESDKFIGPPSNGGPTLLAGPSTPNPALTAEFGFLLGTNGVFPPTLVLDTSSKTVTITNNTGTPQTFTAMLSGPGFGFMGGTQNVTIPGNGQANIILSFSPPTVGTFQGTLTVSGPGGTQTLNLSGIGLPPGVPSVSVP